jgi:hypothetical protein
MRLDPGWYLKEEKKSNLYTFIYIFISIFKNSPDADVDENVLLAVLRSTVEDEDGGDRNNLGPMLRSPISAFLPIFGKKWRFSSKPMS